MANQPGCGDEALRAMADSVARVCLSSRFDTLFRELEATYDESGVADCRLEAFRDAFCAISHEEGPATTVVSALPLTTLTVSDPPGPRRE